MPAAVQKASFEHPPLRRRAMTLAVIVALHGGFVLLLQRGLLQPVTTLLAPDVVMAVIFPPAQLTPAAVTPTPPAAPAPALRLPPPKTLRPTPRPVARQRAPVRVIPLPVPAPAAPAATAPTVPPLASPPPSDATRAAVSAASAALASELPVPPTSTASNTAPAAPPTISSGVEYVQPPQPDYPAQSRRLGEQGRVLLRVLVNEQGRAQAVEVQQSSGFARLDAAAREAVLRARFRPHMADGKAVTVYAIVPISFRLDT
jgi:protein TonB